MEGSGSDNVSLPILPTIEAGDIMDLASVLGIIISFGAVIFSMHHASHGRLDAYVKPGEMLLVFGGAFGAT